MKCKPWIRHFQPPMVYAPLKKFAPSNQTHTYFFDTLKLGGPDIRNGPNTVSESTVSNTELSDFFCPHRVPGRELSEFLSAYYLCDKANSPSFFAELTGFAPKLSEARWVLFSETALSKQQSARFLRYQASFRNQIAHWTWERQSPRGHCVSRKSVCDEMKMPKKGVQISASRIIDI